MKGFGSRLLTSLLSIALFGVVVFAYDVDDAVPEVTERVARVSFIRGDVQVRRDGSQDWEKAELNLPIVEGDEVAVEADGRLEIQFDKDTHLRVDERSLVQVTQLSDSGIALSVSRGTVSVRLRKLDTDREFFEIDGPGTTIAMQKPGTYRFDAGRDDQTEVLLAVTDGGEARVYSSTSGFSVRSGRSARVIIAGNRAGEWESADASELSDEFAAWTADRDSLIKKVLSDSYYGKYYDQDIYGAEDLSAYGNWEYTSDYGYIWTPYSRAISGYADWSPYRYGSWRWIPPFGWTWVNAEPWGWATYHHGRWIWYRGRWVWTPYGYYRSNRSWWRPALVVVRIINRSICWYPLGYGHRYYNYNSYHDWVGNRSWRRRDRDDDRRGDRRRDGDVAVVVPTQSPTPPAAGGKGYVLRGKEVPVGTPGFEVNGKKVDSSIPPGAIVSLPEEDFGKSDRIAAKAPPRIVKGILDKVNQPDDPPVKLPAFDPARGRGTNVSKEMPRVVKNNNAAIRVGASAREPDIPLDRDLQRSRIYGDRQVLPRIDNPRPQIDQPEDTSPRRPVGAVTRAPEREQQPPKTETERPTTRSEPVRGLPRVETPKREIPRGSDESQKYEPPVRRETPQPRIEQPRVEPKRDPVPRQEQPRSEPPPRREIPRQEKPEPRNDPPPRREQPAERKPDPPQAKERPAPSPRTDSKPTRKPDPIDR